MANDRTQPGSSQRIGLINIDGPIAMPKDILTASSAGIDLGPIGSALKATGQGVLAISILASCAPSTEVIPAIATKETAQPHTGAIFESHDFTDFYRTDPSVKDLMTQLEAKHGAFDESWALTSIQAEKSVNTVQFFGFKDTHVVGFWTTGANQEPVLQKENIQTIKGRYVYDNTSGTLTYELMVSGTDKTVSQTFLKMSVDSKSLTSLDSLVMSANSGDVDAQQQLTDMLGSNKGNFTISLTNLASGRTDIGTLSPNQMTEVPPTASPAQPSLFDRIMAMGVTPVSALGAEPTVQVAPTPMLTFEQQIAAAEFVTSTLRDEVMGSYANSFGLEASTIKLHTETFSVNGKNYAFQLTEEGRPLFQLSEEGKWIKVNMKDIVNIPGGVQQVGSENRMTPDFFDELNQATLGVYWVSTEPQKGNYDFTSFDAEIAEQKAHGTTIRGHALVFPTSLWTMPDWLQNGNYSKEELENIMVEHITALVTHGKALGVTEWVVVNEPYLPKDRENDIFYKAYGGYDYIDVAFAAARKADPNAILIYNDVDNHSSNGGTTKLTQQIVARLKTQTVVGEDNIARPVLDAVGIQAHLGDWVPIPNSDDVEKTLKSYGLPIVLTEFDYNLEGVQGTNQERYNKQAQVIADFLQAAINAGADKITFWGLSDANNWLVDQGKLNNAPALFDKNGLPKPVYYEVLRILLHNFLINQ